MEALLGGHGGGQHIQANRAGQLALKRLRAHRDLCTTVHLHSLQISDVSSVVGEGSKWRTFVGYSNEREKSK